MYTNKVFKISNSSLSIYYWLIINFHKECLSPFTVHYFRYAFRSINKYSICLRKHSIIVRIASILIHITYVYSHCLLYAACIRSKLSSIMSRYTERILRRIRKKGVPFLRTTPLDPSLCTITSVMPLVIHWETLAQPPPSSSREFWN